jgi:hypothetical protein
MTLLRERLRAGLQQSSAVESLDSRTAVYSLRDMGACRAWANALKQ